MTKQELIDELYRSGNLNERISCVYATESQMREFVQEQAEANPADDAGIDAMMDKMDDACDRINLRSEAYGDWFAETRQQETKEYHQSLCALLASEMINYESMLPSGKWSRLAAPQQTEWGRLTEVQEWAGQIHFRSSGGTEVTKDEINSTPLVLDLYGLGAEIDQKIDALRAEFMTEVLGPDLSPEEVEGSIAWDRNIKLPKPFSFIDQEADGVRVEIESVTIGKEYDDPLSIVFNTVDGDTISAEILNSHFTEFWILDQVAKVVREERQQQIHPGGFEL